MGGLAVRLSRLFSYSFRAATAVMLTTSQKTNAITERTMPTMPQILPPVALLSLPRLLTACTASTMATTPRITPRRGSQLNRMARMPQTSAPIALPLLGETYGCTGWPGW